MTAPWMLDRMPDCEEAINDVAEYMKNGGYGMTYAQLANSAEA